MGAVGGADAVPFGLVGLIRPKSAKLGGCLVLDRLLTRRIRLHTEAQGAPKETDR